MVWMSDMRRTLVEVWGINSKGKRAEILDRSNGIGETKMKCMLPFLAFLIALPAQASVYARNDDSDINNNVNISVTNEWVGGLLVPQISAVLAIPPRVATQYHVIRVCHDGTALGSAP